MELMSLRNQVNVDVEKINALKQDLRVIIAYLRYTSRDTRGLINSVGTGLNFLFGTAMQSQVDIIPKAVKINFKAVMSLHGMVHSLIEQLSNMSEIMETEMKTTWSAMNLSMTVY